ncbi:MAG: galactokinase [Bdellovibrionaceae bacterium]|nr:galactokinase [Pseudobdellovibrionaceae bacterium]NUM57005.1 galactokinase [Pseudobdellovibrionaceae bacterium]
MSEIIVKSPTRVDLAGGTLDLWPLYSFLGKAQTINVAIDVYSEAKIVPRADQQIVIHSWDLNYKKVFSNLSDLLNCKDQELSFYKPILNFFVPTVGFELHTKSQSPVGGGLGGSSSLLISVLKAFHNLLELPMRDSHEMVYLAHNLEAQMLMTPTGTQDYYPAYSGGLNLLTYTAKGIEQKVISVGQSPLKDNFLLVYTGKSHHSGINNFEVLKSAVSKDKVTLSALHSLNEIAAETRVICEVGAWNEIPRLFNLEFKYRLHLTSAFSSPEILKLKDISLSHGAKAIKICGAGGGGCVLIWVESQDRSKVIKACEEEGFSILNSAPVDL